MWERFFNERDFRVEMVRKEPMLWIQYYLKDRRVKRTPQGEVIPCRAALLHKQMTNHFLDQSVLAMCARGLGKSFHEMARLLWMITTDPDGGGPRFVLYITSPQVVRRMIKEIARELMFNPLILNDFGKLLDDTCTIKTENEPEVLTKNGWQVCARSIRSGVRGLRPAELICDDILDRDEIKNPDLREKMFDLYYKDLMPMLLPGARKRLVGTPMHPEDLIVREYEEGNWDVKLFYPVEFINQDGKRESAWPEMFTLDDLDKIQHDMDSMAFGSYQQEYLLMPFIAANQLWTKDMIQYWEIPPVDSEVVAVTAIDLATGVREENAETAIITVGGLQGDRDWGRQGEIFEMKSDVGHYTPDQVVHHVIQHCERFNFRNRVIVEDKAWHNAFETMFRKEIERRGYSMPSFEFVKASPGEDKKTRAESIIQFYKDRKIYHMPGSKAAQQMLLFTGRKKERNDAVDAMVHALRWFMGKRWYRTNKGGAKYVHRVKTYDEVYGGGQWIGA